MMKKEVIDAHPERLTARQEAVSVLADAIRGTEVGHPVRVAVDGPDAAGKTTLADELAEALRTEGREVVRASIDGFHRPRAQRYARGAESPVGYFEDSFDYEALRRVLLDPLGPSGTRRYRTHVFDFRTDQPVDEIEREADERAVLIFDGVFLLRAELKDAWDYRIFVEAPFDETLRRAVIRDAELMGGADAVTQRYRGRYIPGQELYLAAASPAEFADVVVHNVEPEQPGLTFQP
jgi:uridine kinase